jgi:predicted nucleotidyltransferase
MAFELNAAAVTGGTKTKHSAASSSPNETLEIVTQAVRNYAKKAGAVLPIVKAYLFGSWAKGTATESSDVDVCFFLEGYSGRQKIDVLADLSFLRLEYSWLDIELHAFPASFLAGDHFLVREIVRTGIEIWPDQGSEAVQPLDLAEK